jgi:hypothetical protein
LFGGEVLLHGCAGTRSLDLIVGFQYTLKKKASKEGGDGGRRRGKEESVGQLCLWQLVALFLRGN